MTRIVIVFIITFLCINFVHGQTELYPGLIKIFYEKLSMTCSYTMGKKEQTLVCKSDTLSLKFYKSPNENDLDKELTFYYTQESPRMIKRVIQKDFKSWLKPAHLKCDTTRGDYDILFICKTKSDNWYEVVINEETKETRWINEKRLIKFLSWNKLSKTHITVCVQPQNTIYSKADSNSTALKHMESDFFEIMETKGTWMKIKAQPGDPCGNSTETIYFAWFNYKSRNKLFFNFHIDGFLF